MTLCSLPRSPYKRKRTILICRPCLFCFVLFLQGGIHPDFTGDTYLRLLAAAKRGAPDIHVHAFRWGARRGEGPDRTAGCRAGHVATNRAGM